MNEIYSKYSIIKDDLEHMHHMLSTLSKYGNYNSALEEDIMKYFSKMYPLRWDTMYIGVVNDEKLTYSKDKRISIGRTIQVAWYRNANKSYEVSNFKLWLNAIENMRDDIIKNVRNPIRKNAKDFITELLATPPIFMAIRDFEGNTIPINRNVQFVDGNFSIKNITLALPSNWIHSPFHTILYDEMKMGVPSCVEDDTAKVLIPLEDTISDVIKLLENTMEKYNEIVEYNKDLLLRLRDSVLEFIVLEELQK